MRVTQRAVITASVDIHQLIQVLESINVTVS